MRAGVPLIAFVLGTTYAISIMVDTHVEAKDRKDAKVSIRKFNLDEEHRTMMQSLDIDNYQLSRIPRPGEGQSQPTPKGKNMKKIV